MSRAKRDLIEIFQMAYMGFGPALIHLLKVKGVFLRPETIQFISKSEDGVKRITVATSIGDVIVVERIGWHVKVSILPSVCEGKKG